MQIFLLSLPTQPYSYEYPEAHNQGIVIYIDEDTEAQKNEVNA